LQVTIYIYLLCIYVIGVLWYPHAYISPGAYESY
jgi:hypothetical protein